MQSTCFLLPVILVISSIAPLRSDKLHHWRDSLNDRKALNATVDDESTLFVGETPSRKGCRACSDRNGSYEVTRKEETPEILTRTDTRLSGYPGVQGGLELTVCREVVPGGDLSFDLTLINQEPTPIGIQLTLLLLLPTGDTLTVYDDYHTLPASAQVMRSCSTVIPMGLARFGSYTLALLLDGEQEDDFQVELNGRKHIEVRWYDTEPGGFWVWYDTGNVWAIRGCLPEGAFLDSIGVRILSENDPYWPWPDDVHQAIELQVYDDDGPGGLPGTVLYTSGERYVDPVTGHAVAYPDIPVSGTFYIGNLQLTDYPSCEAQSVDQVCDHPDEMFHRINGVWSSAGCQYNGDFMIWGVGHMPGRAIPRGERSTGLK